MLLKTFKVFQLILLVKTPVYFILTKALQFFKNLNLNFHTHLIQPETFMPKTHLFLRAQTIKSRVTNQIV